jgi:hypothetical protein
MPRLPGKLIFPPTQIKNPEARLFKLALQTIVCFARSISRTRFSGHREIDQAISGRTNDAFFSGARFDFKLMANGRADVRSTTGSSQISRVEEY